jgi:hypothetical protein
MYKAKKKKKFTSYSITYLEQNGGRALRVRASAN